MLGQGIDAPEWYGRLEVRSIHGRKGKPLFTSGLISGLDLSTAAIVADLLPDSQCLWIVSKAYGWSDPHCEWLDGELFRIDGETLIPIWKVDGSGHAPTIEVASEVWAETQQELENLPSKPKRVKEESFVYGGRRFVSTAAH